MPTEKSPFKFLDAYDKHDKEIFFGRESETYELYDRLFETNIVLLYGASGTGKTSLINCGLANQFESSDWYPIFIRRGDNIMDAIYAELSKHSSNKFDTESSLKKCVKTLYLDHFKAIYLIFDQFEELFILGKKEEQHLFFEALRDLLDANLQCKVIISMREEYVAQLSEFEHIVPTLFDNRIRIERMNNKNLKAVIEGTARAFNIELDNKSVPQPVGTDSDIEKDVADLILAKLKDSQNQIDLANLQVYLDRLYRLELKRKEKKQRKDIVFDNALINTTGNLADVLSMFLDEQLEILTRELKQKGMEPVNAPLDILFTLVTDTGTKQAANVSYVKKQLKRSKNIGENVVDYCIHRLKEMRIIRELSE